jgi:hypothetical protein
MNLQKEHSQKMGKGLRVNTQLGMEAHLTKLTEGVSSEENEAKEQG